MLTDSSFEFKADDVSQVHVLQHLARLDLQASDLEAIHQTARELNSLEGITGRLIFNGTHFLHIIQGAPNAIEDLLDRLRRDPRHSGIELRDQQLVD